MASFNKVTLVGNITREPELRVAGQTPVLDLGLAVNEKFKDEEYVNFFDVTVWGKTAESVANYKQKGDPILVHGRLRHERWENEAGESRSKVKVVAETIQFLNRASGEGSQGGGQSSTRSDNRPDKQLDEEDFDDIPF